MSNKTKKPISLFEPPVWKDQPSTSKQVGGDHYRTMTIQPVEFIHANGIGYMEGSVIKYVSRHRAKGGRQDLEKAIHFLQLLIEKEYPNQPETK